MKIVADENIPFVNRYFGNVTNLQLLPGRSIAHRDLIDADVLLVRSVTYVTEDLLKNTRVKFVGSATTGFDHLDIEWLNEAGIAWSIAKGCNAAAVVEYVICVIAALQKMDFLNQSKPRAGVIGVGTIGQQVAQKLEQLGFDIVYCDPFRNDINSTPLEKMTDLDLITLHVPLTRHGSHPTYHMINEHFLKNQKKNGVLLNTSRGKVISFEDLKMHGQHLVWCLDVWENEPDVDFDILEPAIIATPHIAGYSVQSKFRGIEMLYRDAVQQKIIPDRHIPLEQFPLRDLSFEGKNADWRDVVLTLFNPNAVTAQMKEVLMENAEAFDHLRKTFKHRDEFAFVNIENVVLSETDKNILHELGVGA